MLSIISYISVLFWTFAYFCILLHTVVQYCKICLILNLLTDLVQRGLPKICLKWHFQDLPIFSGQKASSYLKLVVKLPFICDILILNRLNQQRLFSTLACHVSYLKYTQNILKSCVKINLFFSFLLLLFIGLDISHANRNFIYSIHKISFGIFIVDF